MDAGTIAAWVRDRLVGLAPDWLDPYVYQVPDGLLVFGAPTVVFVLALVALKGAYELWDTYVRAGDAIAGRKKPDPATQDGQQAIQRQLSEIIAVLENRQSQPLAAEAEEAREAAVADLVEDTSAAAEEAASDLAQGDLDQGFAVLEREARAAEAMAVDKWRRLGALAAGVDTARARAAYEEAFRLDPTDFWTCVFLARLRREAGDLDAAQQAIKPIKAAARSEREHAVAENEAGDVLLRAGDAAGAKHHYEAGLVAAQLLAAQNPGDAQAQRNLSVSLAKVGDVLLVGYRNPEGAGPYFYRAAEIARRHAAPHCLEAQRDVAMGLSKLGDASVEIKDGAAAHQQYTASLDIFERLAAAKPGSLQAQRDVLTGLRKLADALVMTKDWAGA